MASSPPAWYITRWEQLRAHRTGAVAVATSLLMLAALVALPSVGGSDDGGPDEVSAEGPSAGRQERSVTTVEPGEAKDAPDAGGTGGSSPETSGDETAPGGEGEAGESQPAGPTGGPAAPGGASPAMETGRGVTDTEIRIGFWVVNTDTGCASVGLTSSGPSCDRQERNEINALTNYVNANGGVAGRKLVPVIHESDATAGTYSGQSQAACAAFTQDNEVFAVVSEGSVGRPFMAHCIAQQQVPVIDPGFWAFDDQEYQSLGGFLYQPSRPRPERWVAAYIDGLADQGFFSDDAKVGLLRFDAAPFDRVTEKVLKPRLAAHGQSLTEEIEIKTPDSVSAYGDMNQALANAILRFRTRDVDHVIFFTTQGEMAVFYFQQAEAASYRPRYGVSSMEALRLQSDQGPARQFENAVGVGWMPQFDVFAEDDPGGSATADLCRRILQDAGIFAGAGRTTRCDSIFFLDTVLDRATALTADGFRATVEALGSSFAPAATFATTFGPGRHDGPSGLRYVGWQSDCGCFKYRGGTRPLP